MKNKKKKSVRYEPKTHDFRAQSKFHPQPDSSVEVELPSVEYIDPRDTIILDPIL